VTGATPSTFEKLGGAVELKNVTFSYSRLSDPVIKDFSMTLAPGSIGCGRKMMREIMKATTKVNGVIFSLFSGIQKIKLGGCENRAFTRWAEKYKLQAEPAYNPVIFLKLGAAFQGALF
jgi:ABC-type bacteriocin/lantibiotic exporter with double-glycine peptidase domain